MAGPVVLFTEDGRCKLARVVAISHWLCVLPSLFCLLSALVIQLTIEDKISFIESYNGAALPGLLVFTGSFGFFLHVFCGKVAYSNRRIEKREKWLSFLLPVAIATFILFVLELTCGVMCIVHIDDLEEAFDKGIRSAMTSYRNNMEVKEELDVLQMSLQCCGSRSYKDWFAVSWIHPNYAEKSSYGTLALTSDDVPFSCCSPKPTRPCIYRNVHENGRHYNYDYRTTLTLYKTGCTDTLIAYYKDSVLTVIGCIVLILSFVQFSLSLATRLLQTALLTASKNDDDEAPSLGYLISPPYSGGLNDTVTTATSDGMPLLDTTGESDDARYVALDFDADPDLDTTEPMEAFYENVPPFDPAAAEEAGVTENKVEEYLLSRFNRSMEMFEAPPPPPPDYAMDGDAGSYVVPEPAPHRRTTLTEVKSHHGSYMAMDMSNSSKKKLHRSSSNPPVHRHRFPSPVRLGGYDGDTLVIDINKRRPSRETSGHSKRKSVRGRQPVGNCHKPSAETGQHGNGPHRRTTDVQTNRSNHAHYANQTAPTGHVRSFSSEHRRISYGQPCDHTVMSSLSPIRRRSPVKPSISCFSPDPTRHHVRRSPNKYMTSSPIKTKFKAGVSKDCNHGFD